MVYRGRFGGDPPFFGPGGPKWGDPPKKAPILKEDAFPHCVFAFMGPIFVLILGLKALVCGHLSALILHTPQIITLALPWSQGTINTYLKSAAGYEVRIHIPLAGCQSRTSFVSESLCLPSQIGRWVVGGPLEGPHDDDVVIGVKMCIFLLISGL